MVKVVLYQGWRPTPQTTAVVFSTIEYPNPSTVVFTEKFQPLPHIVRHSPDGFEWGYGGSGPTDLALAILTHHMGQAPDTGMVRDFTRHFVANFPADWSLSNAVIDAWIQDAGS